MSILPLIVFFSISSLVILGTASILFGKKGREIAAKPFLVLLDKGIVSLLRLAIHILASAILRVNGTHPDQKRREKKAHEKGFQKGIAAQASKAGGNGKIRTVNTRCGLKNPFSPPAGFHGDYKTLIRDRYDSRREEIHKISMKEIQFSGPWAEEARQICLAVRKRAEQKIKGNQDNIVLFPERKIPAPEQLELDVESAFIDAVMEEQRRR